jgi:hypothetical protein
VIVFRNARRSLAGKAAPGEADVSGDTHEVNDELL